jgi:LysR family transcriptional regulator, hydrogen peroxide-inducible genes activator
MKLGAHPFTLRQLQYVVAVAEAKSFRGAAERCFVSQPSLSSQIAEVEGALGVRLFERDRRRVLLTPAGEEIVARARRVLLAADDVGDAAKRHVDPLAGTLRIGVIPTMGPYLLPEIDPALRQAFPRLNLVWTEDKTEVLVGRVQHGVLEAALLALEADLGGLEHEVVGHDPFVLALPMGHPLAKSQKPLPVRDLDHEAVLLLDEGHCLRDQALELCSTAGAEELGFRATSLGTLAQMVAGGSAITLLPETALEVENRRGLLAIRPFAAPVPSRTVVLAWRRGSALTESLRHIAREARKAYEQAWPRPNRRRGKS